MKKGSVIIMYCRKCKKKTNHEYLGKNQNDTERYFLDYYTKGFNELLVKDKGKCLTCGRINER